MVGEQKAFGLLNDNPLTTPFKTIFNRYEKKSLPRKTL